MHGSKHQVVFTSGATEANNLAIYGVAHQYKNRGNHIITTMVEHNSVYQTCQSLEQEGFRLTYLAVDEKGYIDLEQLKAAICKETILVSVMQINGEIGTIMPIETIGKLIKSINPNCFFHVDAVQSFGKIPFDMDRMQVDLASVSGHKIYGPKGVGVLIYHQHIRLKALLLGGGQQYQVRSGTIDVPSAVSMSKAMRLMVENLDSHLDHVKKLNRLIYQQLEQYDELVFNSTKESSFFIINFSLVHIKAETFVHALAAHDIYVSSKSACSSKTTSPSRILQAIGKSDLLASQSIRISLSHLTKEADILRFLKTFDLVLKEVMV
jgi:cysteine desulfurase